MTEPPCTFGRKLSNELNGAFTLLKNKHKIMLPDTKLNIKKAWKYLKMVVNLKSKYIFFDSIDRLILLVDFEKD